MKKLLLGLMLLPTISLGAINNRGTAIVGFLPVTPTGGVATVVLNTTSTWPAFSFIPTQTQTLSKVRFFVSAISGVITSTDSACALYTDNGSSQQPGTLIESVSSTATLVVGNNEWGPYTTVLQPGAMYWLVFKTVNPSPGTNNYTIRFTGSNSNQITSAGSASAMWFKRGTTDSGLTWAAATVAGISNPQVGYADGSWDGFASNNNASLGAADRVFASTMTGVRFDTPSNTNLAVAGLIFYTARISNPTGPVAGRLYQGTTLLATTVAISSGTMGTTSNYIPFYFSSSITLKPSTTYRAVLAQTSGTAATNATAYVGTEYTILNDTMTRVNVLWNGQKTRFDGAWTDTPTSILPWGLILDITNGDFSGITKGYTYAQ